MLGDMDVPPFWPLFWHFGNWSRSFWATFSYPPTPKRSFGVQKLPILTEFDLFGPKFHFSLDHFGSNFLGVYLLGGGGYLEGVGLLQVFFFVVVFFFFFFFLGGGGGVLTGSSTCWVKTIQRAKHRAKLGVKNTFIPFFFLKIKDQNYTNIPETRKRRFTLNANNSNYEDT